MIALRYIALLFAIACIIASFSCAGEGTYVGTTWVRCYSGGRIFYQDEMPAAREITLTRNGVLISGERLQVYVSGSCVVERER